MEYKHYVFDVDGTLLDSEYAVLNAWKDMIFDLQGKEYTTRDLRFSLGVPSESTIQRLGITDIYMAYRVWLKYFLTYQSSIKLFDGIPELIRQLNAKGIKTGIVTSKPRSEYNDEPHLRQIAEYMDTVICATDSERHKPYPDPLLVYMERTGMRAQDIIYIGDTSYDWQCARAAGVKFALALWSESAQRNIEADYYLEQPKDILTLDKPKRFKVRSFPLYNYYL